MRFCFPGWRRPSATPTASPPKDIASSSPAGRLERAAGVRIGETSCRSSARRFVVLAVLREAGGQPQHICRMTAFCRQTRLSGARRQLGAIWRELMGTHYPAMSMICRRPSDNPGKIGARGDAVVPVS